MSRASPSSWKLQDKKLRNHDGHFFATITTPLLVIQTYQVTNIIVNDPTTLFWSTICYHHRGWLTRLRRIRSTRRWNKNILLSLRASYHHNTIAMALPSPPLNDIYVCLPRGYVFWPMWCMVLHSSQWYIWYVCIQNIKFYQPPTRTIFCISTTLSPIQWLTMIEIIIYARYVQY